MTDVIDIDNERKVRSQQKNATNIKISLYEICMEYLLCIEGQSAKFSAFKFPYDIRLFFNTKQSLLMVFNEKNECRFVSRAWLESAISEFANLMVNTSGYMLTAQQVKNITDFVLMNIQKKITKLPPSVSSISDETPSFFKIPEIPIQPLQTELLTEYQERMSNFDAFAMYLARICCPELGLYRKQNLWIEGEANSGKTTLMNALAEFLGSKDVESNGAFMSSSTEDFSNRFFLSQTIGKRVINIDEPDPKFVRSERFKNVTGNENHSVEMKGKDTFMTTLDFGIIFTSNDSPPIKNDEAFITRLILCKLSKPQSHTSKNKATRLLVEEMPNFISYGKALLKEHGIDAFDPIPNDDSELREYADDDDISIRNLFEEFFEADREYESAVNSIHQILQKSATQLDARWLIKNFVRIYKLKRSTANFQISNQDDQITVSKAFKSLKGIKIKHIKMTARNGGEFIAMLQKKINPVW